MTLQGFIGLPQRHDEVKIPKIKLSLSKIRCKVTVTHPETERTEGIKVRRAFHFALFCNRLLKSIAALAVEDIKGDAAHVWPGWRVRLRTPTAQRGEDFQRKRKPSVRATQDDVEPAFPHCFGVGGPANERRGGG